ncbi:hypothetical protein SERLA73DRAFT_44012 [Serpula lacrymans var. lacrymans S7.3]|uniref:RWD domain-containing protein n=2 Tax=Serpula lacrymans var. lacrymans TaxID=341189 RepID=F8PGF1_SERL3|nr:uncharacterized protein SERLADRAFT_432883 [Serpula lacrymans var. lacrymans S7.9]EGO05384.1 hypothetical protein SERLA73DRAFT_44012 [Serpula lacrymans var. lacrymans S7.3]EGO31236.1 hypothetical protein SERLADRAFT_432883 [Serpula lacrymans var. lacrymans S7.9]
MLASIANLASQLEELQLIQCSLLPGELFTFILPSDDTAIWDSLLESVSSPLEADAPLPAQARFEIKLTGAKVWFEIELPRNYPDAGTKPQISIKGEDISRSEQEHWQDVVREKMAGFNVNEFLVYQLISILIPMVHDDMESTSKVSLDLPPTTSLPTPKPYHALLTSHHLISPNKRRSLQQWSSELSISGFAKVGYPGVIYAEGMQENVEELQWLALKVRFIEALGKENRDTGKLLLPKWMEFEKVGQVVEEMRNRGREEYITEMGIGSVGLGGP